MSKLEKAAQGVAQCEVSATRVVVDAALLRGGTSRRGGHRIANIEISPVIVNGFKNGFHQWIQRIFLVEKFFCFQNLDPLYRPVAGKPLVLELLCLEVGTSVASAVTAETVFEIIKCMSDVDMPARVRMGSKSQILRFSILATPTIEIFRFFDVGHRQ